MSSRAFLATGYVALALTGAWTVFHDRPVVASVGSLQHLVPAPAAAGAGTPVVAIVLHPQDCADKVEALTVWNALHRSGSARVVGLVVEAPADAGVLERIRRGAGLEFPLRPFGRAETRNLLRSLNYRSTPVALLLDSANRLRAAVPLSEESPRGALDLIMAQVRLLEGGRGIHAGASSVLAQPAGQR